MKRKIIAVLFGTLLCQSLTSAMEQELFEFKEERLSYNTNALQPEQIDEQVMEYYSKNVFAGKEFEACTLEKGTTFFVKSLQPMSSDTPKGSRIEFEADTNLFSPDRLSHVVFTGEVVENKPPRLAGRSGTLKLDIFKVKIDNVTYPAKAYLSKAGKKLVLNGLVAGMPIYLSNLANTADKGTVTIDKIYKDPCEYTTCESFTLPLRTGYYLGGAFLQLADLLVAPLISLFQRGNELDIPKDSSFEIKLASDMSLLRL